MEAHITKLTEEEIRLSTGQEVSKIALLQYGNHRDASIWANGVGYGHGEAEKYWKQRCLEEVGKAWDNSHKRSFWLKQRISLQRGVEPSSKEEYIEQLKKTL